MTQQAEKSLLSGWMELEYNATESMVQAYGERSAVEWCPDPDAPFEKEA